jgi:hypothetical protein
MHNGKDNEEGVVFRGLRGVKKYEKMMMTTQGFTTGRSSFYFYT